jgi:RNA polymerase sigma factor (sigma-70 family)
MNEREMVTRAARGDADAFRALVADYQRLVGHVVFRMIRDQAEREDVCQDVFVRVYRKLHSFRFESKLSTWIARIAHRTCLNHLGKKRMPLAEDVGAADAGMVVEAASVLASPADEAEAREVRAFVRERVETLPFACRTALTLHYLEDMSIPEICAVMDVPAGTVKSHLYRGRALLRQQLLARYAAGELRS